MGTQSEYKLLLLTPSLQRPITEKWCSSGGSRGRKRFLIFSVRGLSSFYAYIRKKRRYLTLQLTPHCEMDKHRLHLSATKQNPRLAHYLGLPIPGTLKGRSPSNIRGNTGREWHTPLSPRTLEAESGGVNRPGPQSEFQLSQATQRNHISKEETEKEMWMRQTVVTRAMNPTTPQPIRDQSDLYKQVISRAIYWGSVLTVF